MDVIKLLEYLQGIIESSSKIPVTGKAVINKREILDIIDQIINHLPDEFKKAQWVCDEKERILVDAKKQAKIFEEETVDKIRRRVEKQDLVKEALNRSEEIIASAQRDAKIMRLGAKDYADEILSQLDKEIELKGQKMLHEIKGDVQDFLILMQGEVTNTTTSIRENVKELRGMK
ncbi:ATPase [Clostridium estertheticum]|uniref:ATPase n=2 Tax=Clostridium estertheticum TaxID=238834 RepID=A0A1J0GI53_9CLOT|nr:ATPase [Clostridium estertheticum]APC40959.1 ATPase [Clostridium estertheticum subsp. estertheticum]MBU3074022.1 ATPase [Clostridium estertheticum]MBU3164116.1 ATPase [Clostridium estertheticum]MBU3170052.1 ATPase [Clostridium estertheticum]MBU3178984.1 ATPase [Clostridium estertheticum]